MSKAIQAYFANHERELIKEKERIKILMNEEACRILVDEKRYTFSITIISNRYLY